MCSWTVRNAPTELREFNPAAVMFRSQAVSAEDVQFPLTICKLVSGDLVILECAHSAKFNMCPAVVTGTLQAERAVASG